ncbi:unnamed protein product [Staurois parvus]|uniref:Uncharacterized protein n=1 Tax=Staurois parvus TaxID=386267 RepID=A0ABN9BBL3_9NEOB|nr:unnamed protein product [Staurois parvus]
MEANGERASLAAKFQTPLRVGQRESCSIQVACRSAGWWSTQKHSWCTEIGLQRRGDSVWYASPSGIFTG